MASADENKSSHRKITMTHTQTTCLKRIALSAGKKGARLAEVGALTLNVRTLKKIGQLLEPTASTIDYNVDIIFIQEHRYTHSKDTKYHDNGKGWTLATASAWKNSVNATVGGVVILIGPRALLFFSFFNLRTHGKQHDRCEGICINPLTAKLST